MDQIEFKGFTLEFTVWPSEHNKQDALELNIKQYDINTQYAFFLQGCYKLN